MKHLKNEPFEIAYSKALAKYHSYLEKQPKPVLELIAQGDMKKIASQNKSKVWWNHFIKEVLKGESEMHAVMKADHLAELYNKQKTTGELIDSTMYEDVRGKL